jgi:hypothetical protein
LVAFGTIAELGQKMGRRQMSVKWRNADDKALQILKGAGVKNLETAAQGATFEFDGDADALDGLLKTLVIEGVRVTEWRGSGDDLEQIFLQSGAKELM